MNQATVTARSAPRKGIPTRTATLWRHHGSRIGRNLGRGRSTTQRLIGRFSLQLEEILISAERTVRRSLHVDATTSQNEGRDTGEQLVMHTINLRYYRRRLRRSERLRYRLA